MAGGLSRDHDSYNHFNAGYDSRVNPLSAIDKKILDFAVRTKQIPALKAHGQILRNFGMYPPGSGLVHRIYLAIQMFQKNIKQD